MKIKLQHLFFLSLICFFSKTNAQDVWTLEQCVNYAIEHNIQIKQKELSVKSSKANLTQSKLSLLPNLNGDASHGYNFGRSIDPTSNDFISQQIQTNSFSLSSSLTIFDGFKRLNTIKESQYDLLANKADAEQTKNDILLNITSEYLQILLNQEQVVIAEQQVSLSQKQVEQTEKMVKAGALPEGNLLDMKAQMARDEINLVSAKNQTDLSLTNLMLSLELEKNITIEKPVLLIPAEVNLENEVMDKTYNEALNSQPKIKSAEFRLKNSEKTLAVARGNRSPTLGLFASMRTNYSDAQQRFLSADPSGFQTIGFLSTDFTPVIQQGYDIQYEKTPFRNQIDENFSQSMGLSLSVPIFNNWQVNNGITRAKINVMNTQYILLATKNQLRKEVQQAFANAKAAYKKYEASLKNIDALKKSFHYTEEKMKVGMINTLDYTTAKNNLATAESDLLQAKYDYIFNLKILDFYQGKPIKL